MKSKVKESAEVAMWLLCKGLILGERSEDSRLHSALLICYGLEKSCVTVMVAESCGGLTTEERERSLGN